MSAVIMIGILAAAAACSDSDDFGQADRTTTSARPVTGVPTVVTAEYECGPRDAPWLFISGQLPDDKIVVADLEVASRTIADSEPHPVSAGATFGFGFEPARTADAFEAGIGTVRLRELGSSVVLGQDEVALRLPPGVSCG